MKINKWNLINYIIAFIPFSSLMTVETIIGDFNYYLYPICFCFFICVLTIRKYILILLVLFVFLCLCTLQKVLLSYPILPLYKQFFPIVCIYMVLYFIVNKLGYLKVFVAYVNIAVIVSILGILQFIIYLLTKSYAISPYGYRVSSIITEPSHLAIVLLPAFVYSIFHYLNGRNRLFSLLFIVCCLFLTQSLSVLIALLIVFPFLISRKLLIKIFPILLIFLPLILSEAMQDENLVHRVNAIENVLSGNYDYLSGQETVYSALTNLRVSIYSFTSSYGLGVGLGGHPYSYDKYYSDKPEIYSRTLSFGINKLNGHNLLFRFISEFGIFFIVMMLYVVVVFIRSSYLFKDPIFLACLVYIVARFIKLGGYFDHGLPVFIIVMFLIFKEAKNSRFLNKCYSV